MGEHLHQLALGDGLERVVVPNPLFNNMHGANRKGPAGASNAAKGSRPASGSDKTANWPGLPGKTQPKARNAGVPKTGHKGGFYVKSVGL